MFARVKTGAKGGTVLSVHRSWGAATKKSGKRAFEVLIRVPDKARPGDVIPDWQERHEERLRRLRANA